MTDINLHESFLAGKRACKMEKRLVPSNANDARLLFELAKSELNKLPAFHISQPTVKLDQATVEKERRILTKRDFGNEKGAVTTFTFSFQGAGSQPNKRGAKDIVDVKVCFYGSTQCFQVAAVAKDPHFPIIPQKNMDARQVAYRFGQIALWLSPAS